MSENDISLAVKDNLTRTFNAGIFRFRLELVVNLVEIIAGERRKLENGLAIFKERQHLLRYDFFRVVAQSKGNVP